MTKVDKLKNCPCCGSDDIEATVALPVPVRTFYEGLAECRECGLEITRTSHLSDIDAWQEVVNAWNRRYADDLKNGLELPAPDSYMAPESLNNFKAQFPVVHKEWSWNLPSGDGNWVGMYSAKTIMALFPGTKEHKE